MCALHSVMLCSSPELRYVLGVVAMCVNVIYVSMTNTRQIDTLTVTAYRLFYCHILNRRPFDNLIKDYKLWAFLSGNSLLHNNMPVIQQ